MTLLTLLAPTVAQQSIPKPWFDTGVNVAVEVAFGCGPLDTVKVWQDVTAWVSQVATNAGRSEELDRFQPGAASVTFRFAAREFDPEYPDGPWYGQILPNVPIRVRAQYEVDGVLTDYFLFTGTVDEWPLDFSYGQAEITVPCTDVLGFLANVSVEAPFTTLIQDEIDAGTGPLAWYRFGDTSGTSAVDEIGGGSLTYTGTFTLNGDSLVAGSANGSVSFADGTDGEGYASRTYSAGQLPGAYPVAVEFLVNGITAGSSVLYVKDSSGNVRFRIDADAAGIAPFAGDSHIYVVQYHDNGGAPVLAFYYGETIDDGTTHHVVLAFSRTGLCTLYVDGAACTRLHGDTETIGTLNPPGLNYLQLGNIGSISTFAAAFDELLIWNRELTAAEILTRSNAALGSATETTTQRAAHILDAIGWDTIDRDIGTGTSLVSTEGVTGTVLDYLMRLNDTEAGQCYADGQGRIVFRGRTDLTGDTRTNTSQAAFGDR